VAVVVTAAARTVEVPCRIEIEHGMEHLHAHVDLDGLTVEAGDSVLVHDAPLAVGFGEALVAHRRATVTRAGRLERIWIKTTSYLALTELFEVGFSERRTS
jgi:hypothetical protein